MCLEKGVGWEYTFWGWECCLLLYTNRTAFMLKLKSNNNERRHPMGKNVNTLTCSTQLSPTSHDQWKAGSHRTLGLPANFIFTPEPEVFWFGFSLKKKKRTRSKNTVVFVKTFPLSILLWALKGSTNQANSDLARCFSFCCVTYTKEQSPKDIYQIKEIRIFTFWIIFQ